jgi:Ca2+-binding EF-hand superfamily protein
MKHTTKLLGMTAAVAVLSAPALAANKTYVDTDADGYSETVVYNELVPGMTFADIDTNGDGKITQREFQAQTLHDNEAAVFAMYDTNQNGVITPAELAVNDKFGNAEDYFYDVDSVMIGGRTFSFLDTNNDGRVSQTEFQNGTVLEETATEFALYDSSQDGYITPVELYTNSKFGNGELVDNNSTIVRSNAGTRIGSLRTKFYEEGEPVVVESYGWPSGLTFDGGRLDQNRPLFNQLDENNDGYITFGEFQDNTIHGNDYAVFAMFDKNQDDGISPREFNRYEKTGGVR